MKESGHVGKSKPKSKATASKTTRAPDWMQDALAKRTKAELVDALMELAEADTKVRRELESRFGLQGPAKDLVAATRQAIADATDFDERKINYNFDYDFEAYRQVARNFSRLIDLGRLREVMELSLELMSEGSCQVEMSDEGLMTEDIEKCLLVVIKALRSSDVPAGDVLAWCAEMTKKDRVGFICTKELQGLQKRFAASRKQSTKRGQE